MSGIRAALRQADIRRATAKAKWYDRQGQPERAALYRAMVACLQDLTPNDDALSLERHKDGYE